MIIKQKLSDKAKIALKTINSTRNGAIGDFCKRAGIQHSQFRKLINDGTSAPFVLDRVEKALGLSGYEPPTAIVAVCEEYGITGEDIKSGRNAEARQVAAYLMSKQHKITFTSIAEELGYSSHAGVNKALLAITDRMDTERELRKRIYSLQAKICM